MRRRTFLAGAALGAMTTSFLANAQTGSNEGKRYRACVIGDTHHGGYGHGHHLVWKMRDDVDVIALADPDEEGRKKSGQESGALCLYADYKEMLEKEKPDLVAIGPRWTINHKEYLLACADVGAHGIIEKPLTPDLEQADEVIAALEAKNLKWSIALNYRASQAVIHARKKIIEEGLIGEILEVRSRGKEDHRSGGEDLVVLGIHLFDLMRYFLGDPTWCMSYVSMDGNAATLKDVRNATESLGPIIGDTIQASFGFESGIPGHYASRKNGDNNSNRWGLDILGTIPQIMYAETRDWGSGDILWKGLPDAPVIEKRTPEQVAHYAPIIDDLIAAIEEDREPAVNLKDGRAATEMIQAVFESHLRGSRVSIPLENRRHPLPDVQILQNLP